MIDTYEFYTATENPAVKQARKILNQLSIPRAEQKDAEQEQSEIDNIIIYTKNYHTCQKCARRGNKTLYLKSTMKEIPRKTKRNGREIILRHYLCQSCALTYKPQSERVGCRTY
jgi:hypothetical protein